MKSTSQVSLGHVVKITMAAALGGFLFGFDSSVINGANGALKAHFAMTDHQLGLAVALSLIGAAIGAYFAGRLADAFGRVKCMLAAAILFTVSAIGSGVPFGVPDFIVWRVIGGVGVVVEVNAETDFVGKNEKFVDFVKGVAATVAKDAPADLDALMACKYNGTDLTVTEQQQEMVLVIGENIKVRRFARFADGVSVPYVHAGGKIGVLVNLETSLSAEQVETVGKDVAMQIAALNPRFWDKSLVTEDVLAEEKKIMMVQMANDPKMANKPEQVREKIAMGKMNKFYEENCLLQQAFVKDGSVTVEQYIAAAAKSLGGTITFKTAVRFEKGEGIEKKQENFAEEIASLVKG